MFIGHTRFSLFAPDSGAWVASNGSKLTADEYRDYLFSAERLDPRCDIFFNYTLPMLAIAAEGYQFRHVVSYSDVLPAVYREQLRAAADKYPFLILDEVPAGGGAANVARIARQVMADDGIPATSPFGSMRLDDDDVLSADYFEQMDPYVTAANVGSVVSLARGVTAIYEAGQFYYVRDAHFPLHSKGHLGVCAYTPGGELVAPVSAPHNKSDRVNPTIIDGRKISHLWVRSVTQDTALYQHGQGQGAQIARIYADMGQYPELSTPTDGAFPVMAGRFHAGKAPEPVSR